MGGTIIDGSELRDLEARYAAAQGAQAQTASAGNPIVPSPQATTPPPASPAPASAPPPAKPRGPREVEADELADRIDVAHEAIGAAARTLAAHALADGAVPGPDTAIGRDVLRLIHQATRGLAVRVRIPAPPEGRRR